MKFLNPVDLCLTCKTCLTTSKTPEGVASSEPCSSNSQAIAITCTISVLVTAILIVLLYVFMHFIHKHLSHHFKPKLNATNPRELLRSGMSNRSTDTASRIYVNHGRAREAAQDNSSIFTQNERSSANESRGDSSNGFSVMEVFDGPLRNFELERNQAF